MTYFINTIIIVWITLLYYYPSYILYQEINLDTNKDFLYGDILHGIDYLKKEKHKAFITESIVVLLLTLYIENTPLFLGYLLSKFSFYYVLYSILKVSKSYIIVFKNNIIYYKGQVIIANITCRDNTFTAATKLLSINKEYSGILRRQ